MASPPGTGRDGDRNQPFGAGRDPIVAMELILPSMTMIVASGGSPVVTSPDTAERRAVRSHVAAPARSPSLNFPLNSIGVRRTGHSSPSIEVARIDA
jgi:hypothetical protein